MNPAKGAIPAAAALLMLAVLLIYSIPVSSVTQTPAASCPPKCKTTTTTTTTTTTETKTFTQTQYLGPGPRFSSVTIALTSHTLLFNQVSGSCTSITGYVWWNVGPIPPTIMWYVLQYADGTTSPETQLALGPAYTQYSADPPTPDSAQYTAAPFTADVCGLQSSVNTVTLYASDPTNTFATPVLLFVK